MTDRKGLAYHDVGHAVMAAVFDILFGQVTINADTDSAGHVALRDPYAYVYGENVGADDRDTRTGRLIEFWLAGRNAEQSYLGMISGSVAAESASEEEGDGDLG